MSSRSRRLNLILGPGDGYTPDTLQPFISFLSTQGFNCIQIPLKEEDPTVSYDDLRADSYCRYIDSFIDQKQSYWMLAISKSCHWFRVYASRRTNIKRLILIEPTTMNPRLLVEFEKSRDNYFITDFYKDAEEHDEYTSEEKALDSIVSDKHSYFPSCPITVIWTTRDNKNEWYPERVLMLKRKFVEYLKRNGCRVKVCTINSEHNALSYPDNWKLILRIIA